MFKCPQGMSLAGNAATAAVVAAASAAADSAAAAASLLLLPLLLIRIRCVTNSLFFSIVCS